MSLLSQHVDVRLTSLQEMIFNTAALPFSECHWMACTMKASGQNTIPLPGKQKCGVWILVPKLGCVLVFTPGFIAC